MRRNLQPPEEHSKLPLTLCSLALFGRWLRKWGVCSPCDCYLSCVSIWLSCERHTKFVILNAWQLEHGDHGVGIDVEMNISTN